MQQKEYPIGFKSARAAYIALRSFIEQETGESVAGLSTKIERDLACYGDDNLELLEKFVDRYQLKHTGFDYSKHFRSEGELFGSHIVLLILLSVSFTLLVWIVWVLSLGKLDERNKSLFHSQDHPRLDLTFGDMLTWYLAGDYRLRENSRFVLSY